jgi:predicted  nucleic acid-binding Zn-ribbon protein
MVTNPFTIDFSPYSPRQTADRPSFRQTLEATIGYTYDPIIEHIKGQHTFPRERQEGYDPFADLGDHGLFAMNLRHATSPAHMAHLKRGIDESIERRRILANSSFLSQLGAGLFDPLNLVALPFGGPTVGFGRSAFRVGMGTAALQTGAEGLLIQPFDPMQTATESTYNIIGAGLFGAAFGGAISIPITRRASALRKVRDGLENYGKSVRTIENISELTADELNNLNTVPRPHERFKPRTITSRINKLSAKEADLNSQLQQQKKGQGSALNEELQVVKQELASYKKEAAIRDLLDQGYTPENLWSIADNMFTDSVLYKFVSTPMKRVLQSTTAPSLVKEYMVKLGGDSGLNLIANKLGIASPLSVYQRAAARNGEWVRAHDSLINLFREDMNLANTAVMDVDVVQSYRSVMRRDDSYGSWLRGINEKRTTKAEKLSEVEKRAISVIDDFFKKAERELEDVGLIGTKKGIADELAYVKRTIESLADDIGKAKNARIKRRLESRVNFLGRKQEELELSLAAFDDTAKVSNDKFLPRFWNEAAIRNDRAKFEDILKKWYYKNNTIWQFKKGKWSKKVLPKDETSIAKRVKSTIDNILNETDPLDEANIGFGYGRSKHFRHRKLDIPNELVWDFIMQDPLAIMKTYTARVAPRLEFRKQFGADLEDVAFKLERDMINKNVSEREMRKHMRDFYIMHDRIAGAVLRNPSAMSQRIAYVMKEAAATNYMGSGFVAAIPEFGRVIMEHDGNVMIKAIQAILDKDIRMKSAKEVRLSGEAIDILKGSAFARLVDDMANNVDAPEFWNKARNAFYTLNGLGPITQLSKTLDGIARGHTIIERSIKLSKNKATPFEVEWLARYGIDQAKAKEIARAPWQETQGGLYVANTDEWSTSFLIPEIEGKTVKIIESNEDGSPVGISRGERYVPASYNAKTNTIKFDREYIETTQFDEKAWLSPKVKGVKALPDMFESPKDWSNFVMLHEIMHTRFARKPKETTAQYENRINKLALEEYKRQSVVQQETVDTFRSAMNSGVLNTILAATPADRPIINDGVVFVPYHIAKNFGYKEDKTVKGYARIENGLLALPFQFYSYTFANVNKMVGAMAHGQLKNRAIGLTTMLGLGYLSVKLRYSLSGAEFAWEDMSAQDRIARAWDASGITALYSDLFYQSMHTSLALGGPNISNGILAPKFPQEPNTMDAITNVAGAGPSIATDISRGIVDFASGNYGEGAKQVVRNLPFARMWFWKDDMNAITRMWAQ